MVPSDPKVRSKAETPPDDFFVKILNSFDIVLISDWKRDPRIWGMMQGIFNLDFMQFHDNGFYKDLKATKPVTASIWGYTFGKITSMHPSLEKWLRKQNYWDHKLYRYARIHNINFDELMHFY